MKYYEHINDKRISIRDRQLMNRESRRLSTIGVVEIAEGDGGYWRFISSSLKTPTVEVEG